MSPCRTSRTFLAIGSSMPWRCGQPHHFVGGLDRFHHLADRANRVFDRLAAAQGEAQPTVAREVAGAGQHQVAEPGQAHQGFRAATDADVEPQHLVEPTGDQAGAGIQAQPHAIGDAGGHREHVLHRAAQFGAAHVVAGVGAERGAMQHVGDLLGEARIVRMHGQRGRQALRHFLGEGRAGDDRQRHVVAQPAVAKDVAGDFVQEAPAAGFEALGRPRHAGRRRPQRRQRAQGFGEGMRGHHDQHQVGIGQRLGQCGGRAQAVGQDDARQVARVLALRFDRGDGRRIAAPQHRAVAVAGDQRGERGAPRARAQDRDRRFFG